MKLATDVLKGWDFDENSLAVQDEKMRPWISFVKRALQAVEGISGSEFIFLISPFDGEIGKLRE